MYKIRRFRPSMRSQRTLLILTIVSVGMYLWANSSRVTKVTDFFEEKYNAAVLMRTAMDSLRSYQFPRGMFIDDVNDPNASALIGQQFSPITTETGDLEAKWTALNPNMAAVVTQYLLEAGLKKGDTVVAGVSGSLPGMNLALYTAAEALELDLVVISSVGASSWGANDPYYTWIDMERILNEKGVISTRSIAASIGGGEDLGRQLSPEGRNLIRQAIERNHLQLIEERILEESVNKRVKVFEDHLGGKQPSLYVNVGGAIASIGHSRNSYLIGQGYKELLPNINYPRHGVIHVMNDKGIPILNLTNIVQIAEEYSLPRSPNPLPEPGIGALFQEERYNLIICAIALIVVIITMVVVLMFDSRLQRLNRPGSDPDTLM